MTQEQASPDPHTLMGQAELALLNEQWDVALSVYDKILAILQQDAQALPADEQAELYNGRGVALLQVDSPQLAINSLNKALELKPAMASAFYNRGLCREALGDTDAALADYNRALELEPQDAEVYFRRSAVNFMREDFAASVVDSSQAIALHPDEPVIGPYIGRGLAYHRLGQFDKARQDYTKALEFDPRAAADAYFYRALVFLDEEDALSARADLQAYLLMTDEPDGLLGMQAKEIIEELDKV